MSKENFKEENFKEKNIKEENLKKKEKFKIEEAFAELEDIVKKMEASDATLEESFDLYTKGCKLLSKCNEQIDMYEKKLIVLSDGE